MPNKQERRSEEIDIIEIALREFVDYNALVSKLNEALTKRQFTQSEIDTIQAVINIFSSYT